jgi:hypothetical protein
MLVDNAVSDNPVDSALSLYLAPLLLLAGYLGAVLAVLWGVPREKDAPAADAVAPAGPSSVGTAALAALLLLGAGCGNQTSGVPVGEADASFSTDAPAAGLDSLGADTSRATLDDEETTPDGTTVDAAGEADFPAFWTAFQGALQGGGRQAIASLTQMGAGGIAEGDFDDGLLPSVTDADVRAAFLRLTPRDFERDGARRTGTVMLGYDGEGTLVPIDEAETESSVSLTFDVVNGDYRLVSFQVAG